MDEVAAEHNSADCIVHYGRACLSPTQGLPVLYVFTWLPLDVPGCCREISNVITDGDTHLLLIYDVRYHYAASKRLDNFYFVNSWICNCDQIVFRELLVPLFRAPSTWLIKFYSIRPHLNMRFFQPSEIVLF